MLKRDDIAAVIFDMDGLVLDTEKTYRMAWCEAGRAMRYDFTDAFLDALSGLSSVAVAHQIESYFGSGFNASEFNRLSAEYWRDHVSVYGIEVKRGFHSLLNYLNLECIPFCLATNSALVNAEECLQLAGLAGVFPSIIARDHVESGKPAPDIFLKAAATLDVPIGRCMVLEDSSAGIEAASKAGAMPVMVPSALPVDKTTILRSRLVLNDLLELLDFIQG